MKKEYLKVFFNFSCVLLIIIFTLFLSGYNFGSHVDWVNQHTVFPDYFRNLFYSGEFFNDFSFHIGAGQNIYNFSYYGLFSPYTFLSLLFPFIKMSDFLIITSIISVIISAFLMFVFLRKNDFSFKISYFSSFLFLYALPLIFHSHRHLMFINYFPFLILALIYTKKGVENKTSLIFILSCFLMILTSFYYAVGGLLTIILYAIYITKNKKEMFLVIKDIFIAILLSSFLLIPVLFTLTNSRSSFDISIFKLLIPDLNLKNIVYDTYGIGLSGISLIILALNYKNKDKKNLFLTTSLLIISLIPIFNYLLNGMLYVRGKSLIPLLPLFIFVISLFLKERIKVSIKEISLVITIIFILYLFNQFTNIFWYLEVIISAVLLYYYLNKKKDNYLYIILLIPFIFTVIFNFNEDYVKNNYLDNLENNVIKIPDIYRFNNLFNPKDNVNRINHLSNLETSIYSSTYNNFYNDFITNISYNAKIDRTSFVNTNTNNIMFQTLMGVKWIYSKDDLPIGYINEDDYLNKNENVLPIGYVNSKYIDIDTFNNLSKEEKTLALINYVVTSDKSNVNNIENNIEIIYESDNETIELINGKKIIPLTNNYQNKIIFITFDVNDRDCTLGDTSLTINNITNTLSCSTYRYYNDNKSFNYVISSNKDIDNIIIRGKDKSYDISNVRVSILDYDSFKNINEKIDKLEISSMKNDKITGHIDVTNNGYFNLSIPYDDNFIIKVNNKKITYEKTNIAFIGFYLEKGSYDIEIEYVAKGKNIGIILSIIGLIGLIIDVIIYKRKRVKI